MSTIAAGTSSGTALVSTGDTTGALVIKTGGSATTAATFNADQTTTFAGAVSAPSFSGTSSTATNLAGGSAGTVPYQSASGTTAMLAAGTSGQVLTSSGAGAPSWTTPSAGAMTLLATVNATSGTYVTFDGYFTSAYDVYLITGSNFFVETAYTSGYLRTQVAIGSTFQTSADYGFTLVSSLSSGTTITGYASNASTFINTAQQNAIYRATGLSLYIYNPLQNSVTPMSWTITGRSSGNVAQQTTGSGMYFGSGSAISGIRFFWSGGDFQSGKFQLYGLKNS